MEAIRRVPAFAAILVAAALLLGGCAADRTGPAELRIEPGGYTAAFDAAREAVLGYGFELDRVDARAGVITSHAKTTGGLATPWDEEQSTARQELEDLINDQQRRVRITFMPDAGVSPAGPTDLRTTEAPLLARIEVAIDRIHKPGWRVEPTSVQQSHRWIDPAMQARGMVPRYEVPFTLDPHLAARIAARIARTADGASVIASGPASPRPVESPGPTPEAPGRGETSSYWD